MNDWILTVHRKSRRIPFNCNDILRGEPDVPDGSKHYEVQISPGLSQHFVPICDPGVKPFVGQIFETLEDGIKFYRKYASECGFDVRLASSRIFRDGKIKYKYVFCNREGEKNSVSCSLNKIDSNKKGSTCELNDMMCAEDDLEILSNEDSPLKSKVRRVSKRCGCLARVKFKFKTGGGYVVSEFFERHRHILVSDLYKPLLKENKNLDCAHKKFMMNCARANIGATKAYRIYKEFVGGYANVGCTKVEFKNFARDLKAYVVGFDAQMLLDKLFHKKELNSGFVFDYAVDEKEKLTRVFWADATCRRNYATFGDVMSFDATYSTNRYNMIFTPFTGKDNHGKCVTFGIGLICSEDVGAYSWLFEKFVKHMGRTPSMITTDQDPAMKIAIEKVLPDTRQRFCMWHIMNKVSDIVPPHLKHDQGFKDRLKYVVYSDLLEPAEFEVCWNQIMEDFGLSDNSWFRSLFALREMWIPAYFRDFWMSRLHRATSMSESENYFFSRYANPRANLLEFYMNIESALESQRNNLYGINGAEETRVPFLVTRLPIEKHAASIYTDSIFRGVQDEIVAACFECCITSMVEMDGGIRYDVKESSNSVFKVLYDKNEETIICSCKKFLREGLLRAHIFLVLKELRYEKIPEKYLVNRWTKFAYKHPIHNVLDNYGGVVGQRMVAMQQIMSEFYSCVGLVEGNDDNISFLLQGIRGLKATVLGKTCESSGVGSGITSETNSVTARKKLFDDYYGMLIPEDVRVLPPSPVNNKGRRKRLKSVKEKAVEINRKPMRLCGRCNLKAHHDKRNCSAVLN